MWFQFDYGDGPVVAGRRTWLFCAWLSWSRFRVVIPILDKTLPSVIACIDAALRRFGGVPTYALTDNEKTVTTAHVARIAIRNPEMVSAARHYGLTVATCVVADPESKAWATDCTSWLDGWKDVVPRGHRFTGSGAPGPILPLAGEPRRRRCDRLSRSTSGAAPVPPVRACLRRSEHNGSSRPAAAARRDAGPCRCRPPIPAGPERREP